MRQVSDLAVRADGGDDLVLGDALSVKVGCDEHAVMNEDDGESFDELAKASRSARSAVVAAAAAFFLAELGDKTMLATITLASTERLVGTWVGSTLGMVAADALAILVGAQLGKRLPERTIKIGAAASFVVFGSLLVIEGLR